MEQIQKLNFPVQELQVIYKQKFKLSERPKIGSSRDCYNVLLSLWNPGLIDFHEEFKILLLNRAGRIIGSYEVSYEGICCTTADPKIIFGVALKCSATAIVLAHNHPSGNLKPSQPDINLTQKLCSGGNVLDISVLDHMIIGSEGYFSMADEGLM